MPSINQNLINTTISETDLTGINTDIAHIINKLPNNGNIVLDDTQTHQMLSMDVDNRAWVGKVLQVMAGQVGAYIPAFISAASLQSDVTLFDQTQGIQGQLADVTKRVNDVNRLSGHEAMSVALAVYGIIEVAAKAGLPGAEAAYNILKERFVGQGGGGPQQQGA